MSTKDKREKQVLNEVKQIASRLSPRERKKMIERVKGFINDPTRKMKLQFQKEVLAKYGIPGFHLAEEILKENPIISESYDFQPIWDQLKKKIGNPSDKEHPLDEIIDVKDKIESLKSNRDALKKWIIENGEYEEGIYYIRSKRHSLIDPRTKFELQVLDSYGAEGVELVRKMLKHYPIDADPVNYKPIWIELYEAFGEPTRGSRSFVNAYEKFLREFEEAKRAES